MVVCFFFVFVISDLTTAKVFQSRLSSKDMAIHTHVYDYIIISMFTDTCEQYKSSLFV